MNPFSAIYYIRENKGRSLIIILMMALSAFMFMAGNYIQSIMWYWEKSFEYSDRLVYVSVQSMDGEVQEQDFQEFIGDVEKDSKLSCALRSGRSYAWLDWRTTLGFDSGSDSYQFRSVEDMRKVFERLGIECDYRRLGHRSMVISSALARNKGLKLSDKVDDTVQPGISGEFTVDAIIEDDGFATFYIIEAEENDLYCAYIYSDSMEGEDLYGYVRALAGDRNVAVYDGIKVQLESQLLTFNVIFVTAALILSIVLAVTINSVVTGQYMKRTYEFGVYRALGRGAGEIRGKVMREILLTDGLAVIFGFALVVLLSYLLNELYYIPHGQYLPMYSELGVWGFVICNVIVVVPMILLKGRSMSRADVTEF